ncbi:hypothetical protein RIR_jg33175.t1 [Rhizophagus irregularis DAOM 181602=DAOM 197198]|nr:hypothetical protein RIR_jg33175.t1 [Rhizophagus irregularis DAOM 181602=DAOM 197198]
MNFFFFFSKNSEIHLIWSCFNQLGHEKKRNRLTNERVLKLVYIYSNYKINCPRQELHPDIMEILTEDESEELLQNDSDYEVIDSEE